jgi:hypothetical protein
MILLDADKFGADVVATGKKIRSFIIISSGSSNFSNIWSSIVIVGNVMNENWNLGMQGWFFNFCMLYFNTLCSHYVVIHWAVWLLAVVQRTAKKAKYGIPFKANFLYNGVLWGKRPLKFQ